MDKKKKSRGLGRGLSALMADVEPQAQETSSDAVQRADIMVPIESVRPNPEQPRRQFTKEQLDDLAASIREKGVIQPLIVRPDPDQDGAYQIVAGERRWRAAQLARLHELPVLVRTFDDVEVLEVAIIENIQRADLNPVEEASGYRQLMDRFGHTQEKIAEALGKSRSHIANLLRLLTLPDEVKALLESGELSAGHARALVTADDPVGLARQVVSKGLSVRETEKLAKGSVEKSKPAGTKKSAEKDADTRALEGDLSANLGLSVSIDHSPGEESGRVTIRYKTLEELDEICRVLTTSRD